MIARRVLPAALCVLALSIGVRAQSAQELYQRGLVQEQANGNLPQAIALYVQAAQAAGPDRALAARALIRVAGAREKLGQPAEAVSAYAQVVRVYPEQRTEVAIAEARLAALRRAPSAEGASSHSTASDVSSVTHPLFETYCVTCHNPATRAGGLDLEALSRMTVGDDPGLWEKVARRLKSRRDPPIGLSRPDDTTYRSVIARIEQALDAGYEANRRLLAVERVDGTELATRIASFLWNGAPDAALIEAARRGDLREASGLREQIARMLRDPRSDTLVDRFFAEWLSLERLRKAQPDPVLFPHADAELLRAMDTETRFFVASQLREDRDAVELWTANYTYVDERLARHYGLPGISGKEFRRVTWPNTSRAGLLGQAGPLTALSQTARTSPTARGIYVLSRFLGIEAPSPPANVPALPERDTNRAGTMRDRIAAHKFNPSCASCHAMIDPLGFALENFDATGAWRTTDAGSPIDTSGTFIDGTRFDGPAELRAGLMKYRDAYYANLTQQLLGFALNRKGRGGRVYDYEMPAVRAIVRDAAAANYRWSSILAGIVASPSFQMKTIVP